MKIILLFVFSLILSVSLNAQPGALDPSFGNGGKVLTNIDQTRNISTEVLVQPDGKIVVIGYCTTIDYTGYFALARYKTDGSLDTNFGLNGIVTTIINGFEDIAFSGVLQSDGKIIAAGYTWTGSSYDFAMIRYNNDGTRDLTFGSNGIVKTDFYGNHDKAKQVILQPDGNIILMGYTGNEGYDEIDMAFAKYHSDGSLDQSFGNGGVTIIPVTDFAGWDMAEAGALQSDGNLIVAGFAETFNPATVTVDKALVLLRLYANGTLDQTFGSSGITRMFIGEDAVATDVVAKSDGKILVLAETKEQKFNGTTDLALLQFTNTGALDSNFGTGGLTMIVFDNSDDAGRSLLLQPDQKIIAAGYTAVNNGTTLDFALARINPDGSLDNTFGNGGKVTIDFQGGFDFGYAAALQKNGKIIMAGSARNGSDYDFALVKLTNDAALPVTMISFNARLEEVGVALSWTTSMESNSNYLQVEKSVDGLHWSVLDTLEAAHFTLADVQYSTTDKQPTIGRNYYYRLKMVDFDRSFAYSSIVSVNFNAMEKILKAYPNPTSGVLRIDWASPGKITAVRVFDARGNPVTDFSFRGNDFDFSSMANGFYNILVTDDCGRVEKYKIMLNK